MSNNEIEIKLVLDQEQLNGPTALQLVEMFREIVQNGAFGDAVEDVFRDRSSFVRDLAGMMDVPDRGELDDYKYDIINSSDFEESVNASVDSYIGNSDLYYLPDTVSELQEAFEEQDSKYDSLISDIESTLNEYDFDQMQDDLNRDEEAIDDLKDRVNILEDEAGLDWRTEFGDRLDTIEEKLGTDWSEEDNREISRLQERVDKLEQINERLFHIIHNVQGVSL